MLLLLDCLRLDLRLSSCLCRRCRPLLLLFCQLQGLVQGHDICDCVILGLGCRHGDLRGLITRGRVLLHAIGLLILFGLDLFSGPYDGGVLGLLSLLREMLAEHSHSSIATILHLVRTEVMYVGLVNLREMSEGVLRLHESIGLPLEIRAQVIVRVVQSGGDGLQFKLASRFKVVLTAHCSQTTLCLRS